jgi:hypothetical protein
MGEGGTDARSAFVTGEGYVSARPVSVEAYPSSGADFVRATFSHRGRRKKRRRERTAPPNA